MKLHLLNNLVQTRDLYYCLTRNDIRTDYYFYTLSNIDSTIRKFKNIISNTYYSEIYEATLP